MRIPQKRRRKKYSAHHEFPNHNRKIFEKGNVVNILFENSLDAHTMAERVLVENPPILILLLFGGGTNMSRGPDREKREREGKNLAHSCCSFESRKITERAKEHIEIHANLLHYVSKLARYNVMILFLP